MIVLSDFNLFCDSQNLQVGKGDDYRLALGSAGIQAGDGQFIKLSLQSFNMYKNFYNVNANNNEFTVFGVITTGLVAFSASGAIPSKNYKTIGDIATAFSVILGTTLATAIGSTAVISVIEPSVTLNMDDTSNRIISFTVTTGLNLTSLSIQCTQGNDSYALLGVDEIPSGTTGNSFSITGATTSWAVSGKYPAQRSTEPFAYLRCDAVNNNLEMSGLSAALMPLNISSILSSDILMKCPIDHEFINFSSATGQEFIMNLPNKTVNSLHFYLTDGKGRPLGRAFGTETVTTLGSLQTTRGNFNMNFVIKVEIIQAYQPNKLISEPPPLNPLFAKKQGVLNNMNFGAGSY